MNAYLVAALAVVAAVVSLALNESMVAVTFMVAATLSVALHAALALRQGGTAALRPMAADDDYDRRTSMAGSLELNNNWYNND